MTESFLESLINQPEPPPQLIFQANRLLPILQKWLKVQSLRDKRRFLEAHSELLCRLLSGLRPLKP
jgi:hypothetical protein